MFHNQVGILFGSFRVKPRQRLLVVIYERGQIDFWQGIAFLERVLLTDWLHDVSGNTPQVVAVVAQNSCESCLSNF